jgi:transcriptional regulator with XRE-family HTH domain
MTLARLSDMSGVSVGYLSKIERGEQNGEVSISIAYRLAYALQTPVTEIFVCELNDV